MVFNWVMAIACTVGIVLGMWYGSVPVVLGAGLFMIALAIESHP